MRSRNRVIDPRAPAEAGIGAALAIASAGLDRLLDRLLRWQELATQRHSLLELEDHLLKDIGLSRTDALREARRPFWDDPLRPGEATHEAVPSGHTSVPCCDQ
ncbi:MAG: DUF1127 domain-containing protein [Acidiferrobacterales bacterium]